MRRDHARNALAGGVVLTSIQEGKKVGLSRQEAILLRDRKLSSTAAPVFLGMNLDWAKLHYWPTAEVGQGDGLTLRRSELGIQTGVFA